MPPRRLTPSRAGTRGLSWYGGDNRKRISVQVSANAEGHRAGVMDSEYTDHVDRGFLTLSRRPKVVGETRVGSTLRARPRVGALPDVRAACSSGGTWTGDWWRAPTTRAGWNSSPACVGKRVKVRFSYQARGYLERVITVRKAPPVR